MAKRAIIGFKGVALAPIKENTIIKYTTDAAECIMYAGKMNRTAKETAQEMNYDDDIYAQIRDNRGDDVEVRFAEIPLSRMAELGLGTYDQETGMLEADFNVKNKEYAFRCVTDTVSGLPFYFNWRVFELTGLRFDNFQTKGTSIQVCEVIMTGVFKRPMLASAKPYVVREPKEDGSDLADCDTWLAAAETLPKSGV